MANKTAKHKYLLPEIMPESKYVEAMKTTRLSTRQSLSQPTTAYESQATATATACNFIVHFMYISCVQSYFWSFCWFSLCYSLPLYNIVF